MAIPREEQETVVRIGYYDGEVTVSTTNPVHARHMERLGLQASGNRIPKRRDDNGKVVEWEESSWTFRAPASWFKLPRPKRRVSEAQRERFRQQTLLAET